MGKQDIFGKMKPPNQLTSIALVITSISLLLIHNSADTNVTGALRGKIQITVIENGEKLESFTIPSNSPNLTMKFCNQTHCTLYSQELDRTLTFKFKKGAERIENGCTKFLNVKNQEEDKYFIIHFMNVTKDATGTEQNNNCFVRLVSSFPENKTLEMEVFFRKKIDDVQDFFPTQIFAEDKNLSNDEHKEWLKMGLYIAIPLAVVILILITFFI